MIKLSKLTDYAIAVMGQLTLEGSGASRSAHILAEKTKLPEPTVAKVLKLLAKANLVNATRGISGGYQLSKAADQISLAEIIVAMDGPISIVSCVETGAEECKSWSACPVKSNWSRVNDAIKTAFESVMLAEMIAPVHCATHQIVMKEMNVDRA